MKIDDRFKDVEFEGEKAKRVRLESGVGMSQLGRILWPSHPYSAASRIKQIESGRVVPKYPTRGLTENYLFWLAENGYDPFDILEERED